MTSSKDLIDLAVNGPVGMRRGKAMAMKSRLLRPNPQSGPIANRQAFLDALLSQPKTPSLGSYSHPEAAAARHVDRKMEALSPADLAWLERLPKDPAAVSTEDAATIRGVLTSLQSGHASESEKRLVSTFWQPIKQHHDRAQAEHNLNLALRELPDPYDHGSLNAIAEAMRNEDPNLDEEFSYIQARRELDHAHRVQSKDRDRKIRWAEGHLERSRTDA